MIHRHATVGGKNCIVPSSSLNHLGIHQSRRTPEGRRSGKSTSECTSCRTRTEDGHPRTDWRGHHTWTRTLPVDAATGSVGARSFPASKQQGWNSKEKPIGHVLQKSFCFLSTEKCMIRVPIDPPGLRRKPGCAMDERNLGLGDSTTAKAMLCSLRIVRFHCSAPRTLSQFSCRLFLCFVPLREPAERCRPSLMSLASSPTISSGIVTSGSPSRCRFTSLSLSSSGAWDGVVESKIQPCLKLNS